MLAKYTVVCERPPINIYLVLKYSRYMCINFRQLKNIVQLLKNLKLKGIIEVIFSSDSAVLSVFISQYPDNDLIQLKLEKKDKNKE